MSKISRRHFLKTSMAGTMALTHPFARARGANNDIRVAVIGLRTKGKQHLEVFHQLPGVRVTALCDIDPLILNQAVGEFRKRGEKVFSTVDAREI
ncbi:twin-arginine translocation signal domain-containing protein, partial [Planctomycetota bacterium]